MYQASSLGISLISLLNCGLCVYVYLDVCMSIVYIHTHDVYRPQFHSFIHFCSVCEWPCTGLFLISKYK